MPAPGHSCLNQAGPLALNGAGRLNGLVLSFSQELRIGFRNVIYFLLAILKQDYANVGTMGQPHWLFSPQVSQSQSERGNNMDAMKQKGEAIWSQKGSEKGRGGR